MWKALIYKELRDVLPIGCIAVLAYLALVGEVTGYPVFGFVASFSRVGIPFLDPDSFRPFIFFSFVFTVGLGFWQTVKETTSGTWLFLLHRPANRRALIAAKLMTGATVYLVISALAILLYAAWAATPGTHASPFFWWMTIPIWKIWFTIPLCYLGAFLSGIRPGRWFGTRLLPLITVSMAALIGGALFQWSSMVGGSILIVLDALLIGLIFYVARIRDFS